MAFRDASNGDAKGEISKAEFEEMKKDLEG